MTAVDPSASFVEAVAARLPAIEVSRAAAERLPFTDHEFDAAVAQLVGAIWWPTRWRGWRRCAA